MKLHFYGAAGMVTGSNFLIESAGAKILIDCGLQQGGRLVEKENYKPFPYDPRQIDVVLITHAHLDHAGRLPKLYRDGFRGVIMATHPTLDLARLVLDDSLHIMNDEAKRFHEEPFCAEVDVIGSWKLTHGINYGKEIELFDNIKVIFKDAGHILGSAIIEVLVQSGDRPIKLVFSGDLGNPPTPLLQPTASIDSADYVIMESTYGDRIHEDRQERKEKLKVIIEDTIKYGGTLMIPAFALERTQELLFELNNLVESGRIPKIPVFIDSPLAIKATAVYQQYSDYFNQEAAYLIKSGDDLFNFPGLEFTLTTESSKAINNVPAPKVIIAGSGMSEGGRILHHERRYLPDPRSTLLIIGYQSYGTLGRRVLEGAPEIKVLGERVPVRAQIKAIGGYSAHPDQAGLLNWVSKISSPPKRVFTVHGESGPALALALKIRDNFGIAAEVPKVGQICELL